VEGRRAAQSIIIEDAIGPEMKDGFRKSNVVDYGYLDSADISGRVTDIIPNIVDRELNAYILQQEKRKLTPEEIEFKRARGALFGIDSCQASLTNSGIYVDDLHNLHPEGHTEKCDEIVLKLGKEMGYTWVIDKKGDGSYIGFTFNVKQFHWCFFFYDFVIFQVKCNIFLTVIQLWYCKLDVVSTGDLEFIWQCFPGTLTTFLANKSVNLLLVCQDHRFSIWGTRQTPSPKPFVRRSFFCGWKGCVCSQSKCGHIVMPRAPNIAKNR
jgi:hypothetical protein